MHEILHPKWSDRWSRDAPCCVPWQGRLSRPAESLPPWSVYPRAKALARPSAWRSAPPGFLGPGWHRALPSRLGPPLPSLPSAWKEGARGALFFQPRLEVAGQQAARHCCSVLGGKNGLFCVGDLEAGLVTRMVGCRGACQASPWSQAGVEGTPVGIWCGLRRE